MQFWEPEVEAPCFCGYKLLHLRDERYNNSTIKESSFAWDDQISDDFKDFVLLNTLKMSAVMCDCGQCLWTTIKAKPV